VNQQPRKKESSSISSTEKPLIGDDSIAPSCCLFQASGNSAFNAQGSRVINLPILVVQVKEQSRAE
jgi:hypothetical protein